MASEAFNWLGFAGLTVARVPCAPTLAQQKAHVAADLWKDYFRDPSHWWDNRRRKTNPRDPDFKHKVTKESLWIDGLYNPSWVKDRLGLKETEQSSMVKHKEKELEDGGWEVLSSLQEPSVENIACLLHKYTKERNLAYAVCLHAYMRNSGLEAHKSLGNLLVSMLVEVGRMHDAQQVFNRLMYRNDCSWNSLITGYVKHGEPSHALILYQTMQQYHDSAHLSGYTFVSLLKACAQLKDIERGCKIHAEIARKGLLETNIFIGSTLVHMYSKCGLLAKAHEVFDKLQVRDTVLWNALITGYAEHGHGEEALNCFEQMQLEGISPNDVTFVCSLKACGSIRATEKGQELHAEIAKKGLLERDLVVGSTLVDMYAKCGLLVEAHEVFDKLAVRDTVSWSALMAGYAEHGCGEEALNCFEQMQLEGVSRDAFTFACSLKACGSIGAIDKGQEIHAELIRKGFERDLVVGSSLVDMYAKCGLLAKAHEVFDTLPVQDIVLWSSLIAGYAEHGCGEEALNCFNQMQLEGVSPDVVTFACSLKACGSIGAIDKGKEIHAMIAKNGLERDLFVGNTLVDMYGKYGLVAKAQEAFDKLLVRDRVSWNALIAGYAEHGHAEEALNCFKNMQLEGISPNAITFVCILKACGSIGTTDKGQEIHTEIARKGLERDLVVGGTLVHMYARCGFLVEAQEVFEKLPVRHVVSWNALIAGYAQLGESENVFHVFDRMTVEGEKPDLVTFLSVLHACCHAGLVDQGQAYFEAMSKDYGIFPSIEHHTCMVDLLGRAGQLGKAVSMIKKMPYHPDRAVWHTMLGACQKWGNVELGRLAFEHAVHLDEKDAAAYVCMCNIYANAGMWEDANKVEAMRVRKQAWKQPGHCWWTDAEGTVRSFFVSDTGYSQIKNFYAKLEDLSSKMREEGHVLGLQWVPRDVSDDAKKDGLCQHSEKLAIVCALIDTPKGTPVHVVKNLRVCNDCHSAMALISKIEQRSFFVKDANRLHVFEQGKCYCGDCW